MNYQRTVRGCVELPEGRVWSGVYPRVPGEVKRPSQRAGRGRKAFPEGREGAESPSEKLGGVGRNWDSPRRARIIGRPSRMGERGRESLLQGWVGSRGPLGTLGRVAGPSRGAGRGREALS